METLSFNFQGDGWSEVAEVMTRPASVSAPKISIMGSNLCVSSIYGSVLLDSNLAPIIKSNLTNHKFAKAAFLEAMSDKTKMLSAKNSAEFYSAAMNALEEDMQFEDAIDLALGTEDYIGALSGSSLAFQSKKSLKNMLAKNIVDKKLFLAQIGKKNPKTPLFDPLGMFEMNLLKGDERLTSSAAKAAKTCIRESKENLRNAQVKDQISELIKNGNPKEAQSLAVRFLVSKGESPKGIEVKAAIFVNNSVKEAGDEKRKEDRDRDRDNRTNWRGKVFDGAVFIAKEVRNTVIVEKVIETVEEQTKKGSATRNAIDSAVKAIDDFGFRRSAEAREIMAERFGPEEPKKPDE